MSAMRKSAAVLELSGTTRRDRPRAETGTKSAPETPKVAVPKPPTWLKNRHATAKWAELAPLLVERGRWDAGTQTLLGTACGVHGNIVQKLSGGDMPSASMLTQFERLLRGLGFVGPAITTPEEPKENRFARNGRRPA